MRYYLDTNMLYLILLNKQDEIYYEVSAILNDFSTSLYVSSLVVQELILLYRIGKFRTRLNKTENEILQDINDARIEIIFFNQHHLKSYASLRIANEHKDMNDHAIIAQSIADKIPVISSDTKFKEYTNQGLNFIFNKR